MLTRVISMMSVLYCRLGRKKQFRTYLILSVLLQGQRLLPRVLPWLLHFLPFSRCHSTGMLLFFARDIVSTDRKREANKEGQADGRRKDCAASIDEGSV